MCVDTHLFFPDTDFTPDLPFTMGFSILMVWDPSIISPNVHETVAVGHYPLPLPLLLLSDLLLSSGSLPVPVFPAVASLQSLMSVTCRLDHAQLSKQFCSWSEVYEEPPLGGIGKSCVSRGQGSWCLPCGAAVRPKLPRGALASLLPSWPPLCSGCITGLWPAVHCTHVSGPCPFA